MAGINCRECREALTELARGNWMPDAAVRPVERHRDGCEECAAWWTGQDRLSAAIRALGIESAGVEAPDLEAALLVEFERVLGRPKVVAMPRRRAWPWALAAVAVAATVLVWLGVKPQVRRVVAPKVVASVDPVVETIQQPAPAQVAAVQKPAVRRKAASHVSEEAESGSDEPFLEIPFTAPLAPGERADIIRTDVPVSALVAAGFSMRFSDPGANALADVVVGTDGRARAVRVLSISNPSSDRRFQ